MKTNLKKNPPYTNPSFLLRLSFTPDFSTSLHQVAQGNKEWELQSVHNIFFSATHSSLCSSSAPVWDPFHGSRSFINFSNIGPSYSLQFFKNCSSTGSFHGVESFRSRTFPVLVPCEATSLPLAWFFHGLQFPSSHIRLVQRGVLHRLQC